MTTKLPKFPAW